ncbi:DUF4159 domain-containing protein [Ancylothrix sp. C2]|uniref:DUF4159 domain-containing protein n=1 Tax=Ancylothrix sp. D3o TaxID=2953691 RepID=UPI0021BBA1C8|nr:DUF4159 domain-containing protein [Ancylothrix sp. D3o]MCT7948225.1 DUF4159 domain-containing protein [Ancylothrix sp. D3o]
MTKHWPPPNIKPLKRLQVTDGLLIDASRWRLAHEYHRLRQNLQFQSLNHPGIVCDLGVKLIPAPAIAQPQYRDGRWVQIQPGIAIDMFGNFIVVTEPIEFRISTAVTASEPVTVYLVVSYVDPEKTRRSENGDIVQESFRIDEKTSPPNDWEVEVCRFELHAGEVNLSNPQDVFFPRKNDLDLRYRPQAQWRASALVRVGVSSANEPEDSRIISNLSYLLQSAGSLYPRLQTASEIIKINWKSEAEEQEKLIKCDLIFLTYEQLSAIKNTEKETMLREYLKSGGVVLIETSLKNTELGEMLDLHAQLQDSLLDVPKTDGSSYRQQIETEIQALEIELKSSISEICSPVVHLANLLGWGGEGTLHRNHPLRNEPFLFGQLPMVDDVPVQVYNWGGLVLVLGDLSCGWGLDEERLLPRETIRTAQEMGVNLLHFAWRRHQMTLLQQQ